MISLRLIPYAALAIATAWLVTTGAAWVHDYHAAISDLAQARHDASLADGRLASFKRMVERRDAAIAASACKAQITRWVSHPDEIPRAFDPFGQLK